MTRAPDHALYVSGVDSLGNLILSDPVDSSADVFAPSLGGILAEAFEQADVTLSEGQIDHVLATPAGQRLLSRYAVYEALMDITLQGLSASRVMP